MRSLTLLFLLVCTLHSFSQRFGGTPPTVRWMQINTDTARIIFPAGLDSQANRIANIVHRMAAERPLQLGDQLRKVDIVLQNLTTIPNGYVGLGPFRSEFFLTPPMNSFEQGTIPWNDQLAIHEYRHVQQYNNFNRGLSRLMRVLFGEEGLALAINASIPDWFFEGDAVHQETVLTKQGRGRLPLFQNAWPTLWREGKNYSWMKIRNGSLKDYVPGHYHLGYLLVNYGYSKYGDDFWKNVTQDASAFKGLFYPFQKAIKRHTDLRYREFLEEARDYYKGMIKDMPLNGASQGTINQGGDDGQQKYILPVDERRVTNYTFAQGMGDSLVYLKSAYDKLPAFYILAGNGERRIRLRDVSIDDHFSLRNGKIVYSAYASDPRWSWRDYSEIRLLDIAGNTQRSITNKSKYFMPDLSPSGEMVAAVHQSQSGKSELHVLDVRDGSVRNRIRSADILVFTAPKFIDDSTIVSAVRLTTGKSALAMSDIITGASERLTPPSFNVVGFPSQSELRPGIIYFTASYGGSDGLFALDMNDRKISRIVNQNSASYFVSANGGRLTWSVFTAEGYQLQQVKEEELKFEAIEEEMILGERTMFTVTGEPMNPDWLLNGDLFERKFSPTKYPKGKGFFNFHSWRPYYEDPEFRFSLYGNNVLNSTATELYYLYNENEGTHAAGANFVYAGWFPQINAGFQYTFNRAAVISNTLKQWGQADANLGLSIPLNWTKGKYLRHVNLGTNYVFRRDFNRGVNSHLFSEIQFSYLHHYFSFGQQLQMARQQIYPRFGYRVAGNFRHAVTNYTSWQMLGSANLFLPGALPSHSLVLFGAFQETDTSTVLFSNRFPYSRGYNEAYFARMWRLSANYHFPLWYPDWGFGNILYIQRIRANAFFDFTRVYSADKLAHADQRSVGGEMFFDTKWWNQYGLTFGLRVSRLLDEDFFSTRRTVVEVVLPVAILPR